MKIAILQTNKQTSMNPFKLLLCLLLFAFGLNVSASPPVTDVGLSAPQPYGQPVSDIISVSVNDAVVAKHLDAPERCQIITEDNRQTAKTFNPAIAFGYDTYLCRVSDCNHLYSIAARNVFCSTFVEVAFRSWSFDHGLTNGQNHITTT